MISLSFVSAHQPRLVFDKNLNEDNPFQIKNPEISQAFYGELKGDPEYFIIESDNSFNLYIQILSPDTENARKDFSVEIIHDTQRIILEYNQTEWENFYEEFAGDNYWQGPSLDKQSESGNYLIKVYNLDNIGKYVFVVGKKEAFPWNEMLNAIISMPRLKMYFEKSPLTSFFNLIGLFLLIIIIVLIGLILLIIFIIRKLLKFKKS